jgi:AcrR family transcriptional regulator
MSTLTRGGRRETVKAEKRRRIIDAARREFSACGFERATLASIADGAGVAVGTLFLYARDKRELLLMVFNDELEHITDRGLAAVRNDRPLVDELVAYYEMRLAFWGANHELARPVTADIFKSDRPGEAGPELQRIRDRQERVEAAMCTILRDYIERTGCTPRADVEVLARELHYLYIGVLRWWLCAVDPRLEDAVADLRRFFDLALFGMIAPDRSP